VAGLVPAVESRDFIPINRSYKGFLVEGEESSFRVRYDYFGSLVLEASNQVIYELFVEYDASIAQSIYHHHINSKRSARARVKVNVQIFNNPLWETSMCVWL
jgi:hypothetical protein